MKQVEKASIFRIASDLIKADSILDTREIELLDSIREKYSIRKEDEIQADSLTLADAISHLYESTSELKHSYIADFTQLVMSDDYCAREEALLLVALRICLTIKTELSPKVISINTSNLYIEPTQILYVESEFDNNINWDINEHYREITSEIRLAGFDFVYLPKIAEHYRSISHNDIIRIAEFLYPKAGQNRIEMLSNQLRKLSTSEFCHDQIAGKLSVKEFVSVAPSLMIKIGNSFVSDKKIANFLLLELGGNILSCVRQFLDLFAEHYHALRLSYLKEEKGRFIYTGFYKQVFDLYMLRKGVKSSVVIDVHRGEIRLPEADVKIEKLHRREKALYALLLLETASGGINFTKPESPRQLERYKKRMAAIQTKYNFIYRKFGGEPDKAPNIEITEIRSPMISLIKKQLSKLGDALFQVDDYIIQRNIYGNYAVNLPRSLCRCCGIDRNDICDLSDSMEWQKISAL